MAKAKPSAALVLKDPNFVQVLDEAEASVSPLVRIVCMRDPRDIAASFVQIGQRQSQQPSPANMRDVTSTSSARRSLPPISPCCTAGRPNAVMVRYEEIASDPKGSS